MARGTSEYCSNSCVGFHHSRTNDMVSFSYQLQFTSSTHYSFTQEIIPVPEPGTVGMVTMSGLLLASLALARRRPRA